MDFPPINPKRYVELKSNISKLFDTTQDKILRLKKEENTFGIYKQNYQETSHDWILILNDSVLDIYKVDGLRNFPFKSLQVYVYNRIRMSYNPVRFILPNITFREISLELVNCCQLHAETSTIF
jgi:hypothetical protein